MKQKETEELILCSYGDMKFFLLQCRKVEKDQIIGRQRIKRSGEIYHSQHWEAPKTFYNQLKNYEVNPRDNLKQNRASDALPSCTILNRGNCCLATTANHTDKTMQLTI